MLIFQHVSLTSRMVLIAPSCVLIGSAPPVLPPVIQKLVPVMETVERDGEERTAVKVTLEGYHNTAISCSGVQVLFYFKFHNLSDYTKQMICNRMLVETNLVYKNIKRKPYTNNICLLLC